MEIEEAKMKMNKTSYRRDDFETDDFIDLLGQLPEKDRSEFAKWVFRSYAGFIATRREAGLRFFSEHPECGWNVVDELINSTDSNDRDTANEVIQELKDPRGDVYMKQLLYDQDPNIQIDACQYLLYKVPEVVKPILASLTLHKWQWVRERALEILSDA
jgi:hypothetical protein